jgi:hypothetical protein
MDNFDAGQKQAYVIAGCSIGLVLSTLTLVLRFQSRRMTTGKFYSEDWWMVFGWLCGTGIGAMTFWGACCHGKA